MAQGGWSNDAIRTLTIPTGATSGARIVIGQQANGNAITIYDAGNNIVYEITASGIAESIAGAASLGMGSAQLEWQNAGDLSIIQFTPHVSGDPTKPPNLSLNSVPAVGQGYILEIAGESPDGVSVFPTLIGFERQISGSMIQSDQINTNALTHRAAYTLTTNGIGEFNQPHGCSFTPKACTITQEAPGAGSSPINFIVFNTGFTATNFRGQAWLAGALFAGGTVLANIEFWG